MCRMESDCQMTPLAEAPANGGRGRVILEHEYWHVDQFETFGDNLLRAYPLESARVALVGGDPTCDNRYERPAYQHNQQACRQSR